MATKDEIITTLSTLGIEHDPTAPKAELAAKLPNPEPADLTPVPPASTSIPPAAPVVPVKGTASDPRWEKWQAFLAKARVFNPVQFDARNALHEFDVIPESWNG